LQLALDLRQVVDHVLPEKDDCMSHAESPGANVFVYLSFDMLIAQTFHNITPNNWIMSMTTTRALRYFIPVVWDTPLYTWDDPNPLAVWGY